MDSERPTGLVASAFAAIRASLLSTYSIEATTQKREPRIPPAPASRPRKPRKYKGSKAAKRASQGAGAVKPQPPLTQSQRQALEWLEKHGSDGCFDRNGIVLAAGENAPFMRSTWNALAGAGAVEFYKIPGGKLSRVRIKS